MLIKTIVNLAVLGFKNDQIAQIVLEQHPEFTEDYVREVLASEMFKAVVTLKKNAVKTNTNKLYKTLRAKSA